MYSNVLLYIREREIQPQVPIIEEETYTVGITGSTPFWGGGISTFRKLRSWYLVPSLHGK